MNQCKNLRIKVLLIALLFQIYHPSRAAADDWPIGARSLGMGATYVALANTADAVFLNVGGLGQIAGTEISLFYQKPFGISELNLGSVAVSLPMLRRRLAFGFLTFGNDAYREQSLALCYSHHYQRKLYYGIGVRYHTLQIDNYGSTGTFGLDAGFVATLSEDIRLGFSAKNINRPTIGKNGEHLPQTFTSGISVQVAKPLLLNFEIFKDVRFSPEARLGCEFKPFENLALRTGVGNHPNRFSAGVGITVKRITVDYAFFTHNDLGLTHQSSLSFSFGKQPGPPDPKPVIETSSVESPKIDSTKTESKPEPQQPLSLNINTATVEQFEKLPGIGRGLASAIVEFREQNGLFEQIEDLLKVPGIGKNKLERIKPFIFVEK